MRIKAIAIAVAGAALALPASAAAHVSVEPTEAAADGFAFLEFTVPHGCDGAGTTELSVQIPESVPLATPGVHPGWEVTTKEGPKDEVELFGETVTEGVSEVTWTASEPLPDGFLDRFVIEVKLPPAEGETLHFPTIQTCEKGKTAWVEIPAEGETEDDLEAPAPAVTLTAVAEEAHGATTEPAEEADETATDAEEDDDDGNGIAVAALIVGGLGLLAGGASLMRSRNGS